MRQVPARSVCMVLALLLLAGCAEQRMHPGENAPERITLCLPGSSGWTPVAAEVAATPEARRQGLAGRESLARRAGMLFLYAETQGPGNQFWMHRTRMPLTIAFLDAGGTIARLQGMSPCQEEDSAECRRYPAQVEHRAALEVNQGLFEALGAAEGDRIAWDPSPRGQCGAPVPLSVDGLLQAH